LSGEAGVRNRADQLASSPAALPDLAAQLLADTWIVDTLDVAVALAGSAAPGCRFVTLQGELLDGDGSLTVGTVHSESAVVSRKSELRRSKNEIVRLDESIAQDERRLAGVDDSLGTVDEELQLAGEEKQRHAGAHATLCAKLAGHEQRLEAQSAARDVLDGEIAEIESEQERAESDLRDAINDQSAREEALAALQTALQHIEREAAAKEQLLQTHELESAEEQLQLAKHDERLSGLRTAYARMEQDCAQRAQQFEEAQRRCDAADAKRRHCSVQILNTSSVLADLFLVEERLAADAGALLAEKETLRLRRAALHEEASEIRKRRRELGDSQHREEIRVRDLRHQLGSLEEKIDEEYQLKLADVVASGASAIRMYAEGAAGDGIQPSAANPANRMEHVRGGELDGIGPAPPELANEIREQLVARVQRLRRKLKLMGSVNTDSLRDLDELESRHGRLSTQLQDLLEAKNALDEIIRRINAESKRLFTKTFDAVRSHFQELFRKMFGGGSGDILLEDPDDVLDCGVDIVARPPGKEMKSISLMSGGEKTLTALALLLAIFKSRPSPYCVLDEVDAALDEANVDRLLALLEEFKQQTQFILITHKKPTMTIADVLYGVTMEESGVSKRIAVRFEDVRENGELDVPSSAWPSADSRHYRRGAA
jgi:chromosome segregation protein